ncbi:MAG TPA: hypothetical protein VLA96_11765 [Terriglobales bacterium]|nr:hypothetical protein [Terriglobales bacterium]
MPRRSFVFPFILALAVFGVAQTTAPAPASSLRIIAPRSGEKISANFVTVRFELMDPGASADSSPNYQVRLDGRDPVRTTDTEFTFSGLTPGAHTVMVELVDANGTPITGTRVQARFTVASQPMPADTVPDHTDIVRQTSLAGGARFLPAVYTWVERDPAPLDDTQPPAPQDDSASPDAEQPASPGAGKQLPRSSSALPLLSVIGLGALLGGLASAMRTR